jgi:hypothetical protein
MAEPNSPLQPVTMAILPWSFISGSSGFYVDKVSGSVSFVHHERHSAATPQPKFGISLAKALRPRGFKKKLLSELCVFAPWREEYRIFITATAASRSL